MDQTLPEYTGMRASISRTTPSKFAKGEPGSGAGTVPNIYGAWITHIVRRGFVVIFPRYRRISGPPSVTSRSTRCGRRGARSRS